MVDLEDTQFYLCQISRFSCLLKIFGEPIISYTDRLFHSQQAIARNAPTILRQIFLRNRILVVVPSKIDYKYTVNNEVAGAHHLYLKYCGSKTCEGNSGLKDLN